MDRLGGSLRVRFGGRICSCWMVMLSLGVLGVEGWTAYLEDGVYDAVLWVGRYGIQESENYISV